MANPQTHHHEAEARSAILDAAFTRLLHFGYHKTTMAEIADDVGMSAANLYRYFQNKQEIIAECAARCMDERLERLRRLTHDRKRSAAQRLEHYALELIEDSHALAGTDSRIGELVDAIARERPSLVHSKNAIHYALLAEILQDGNDHGEFAVTDVAATACYLHTALTLFEVPLFVGLYPREEFDRRARGLVHLLIGGLRAPAPTDAAPE